MAVASGNDANTVSLLHMDGADGTTIFADGASAGTHAWTQHGNAKISTTKYEFGSSSGKFPGATAAGGDWVDTGDSTDFTFGSGDFTIDFWLIRGVTGAAYYRVMGQCNSTGTTVSTAVALLFNTTNNLVFYFGASGAAVLSNIASAGTIVDTTVWHHIALVRSATGMNQYIDGVRDGYGTMGGATGTVINDSGNYFSLGRQGEYTLNNFNGYIDEFRISKGIARWTSNFTPPVAEYGHGWTQAASDGVTLGESILKRPQPVKADVISLGEAIVKKPSPKKADTISLGETIVKKMVLPKADSISLGDAIFNKPGLLKADIISISEAIYKKPGVSKSDSITLSDVAVKSFKKKVGDSISLIDGLSKRFNLSKTDTITLSDFFSYLLIVVAITLHLSDGISLTDAIRKSPHILKSDSISILDSIVKSFKLKKQDSISLIDILSKIIKINKSDFIKLIDLYSTKIFPPSAGMLFGFVHKKRTMQKGEQGGDFEFIHRGKTDTAIHEKSELEPGDFANAFDPNAFEVGGWTTVIPKDIKDFLFKPIKRVKKE